MHAAVLLHPGTISYRVFGASVSSTRSAVGVLTLGALRLCCHDRAAFRDVLAGCAGAYGATHSGLKPLPRMR